MKLFNRLTVLLMVIALPALCYAHPKPNHLNPQDPRDVPAIAPSAVHPEIVHDPAFAPQHIIAEPPVLASEPDLAYRPHNAPKHPVTYHPVYLSAPPASHWHPEEEV